MTLQLVTGGVDLLHDPLLNKGTAFTDAERDALGLRGLLPPRVLSLEQQAARILENFHQKTSPLEKYLYLTDLQDRNETLFYRVLIDHLDEMMPIIYTPTVGQACQTFGHILRRPRGLYITLADRGRVIEVLRNWHQPEVRVIVVTDGERILGLGDLGANGMGIPIGKLSLYTACAGIHPSYTLPIVIDVGTNNETLLNDPLYIGTPQRRERGAAYDELIEEFIEAAREVFPRALIQLEDFGNQNAFRLLETYRHRTCLFDDDIQGTAAVTLAGLISAMRLTGGKLTEQKLLFLGAGEAGIGIGDLVVSALTAEGLSEDEARRRCWFVDSQGLVVASRQGLAEHKLRYAHDHAPISSFLEAVEALRPTAIIGVSGKANTFTPDVIAAMARLNAQPLIFALSNPTANSECTAEQAYVHSGGRAIFASGSPFAPVTYNGRTYIPGQANNSYIFPGVGLGVVASGAIRVTDAMFFEAAKTLAGLATDDDLAQGRLYPALTRIREVSAHIAAAVAQIAWHDGLATRPRGADLLHDIRSQMYEPGYQSYV